MTEPKIPFTNDQDAERELRSVNPNFDTAMQNFWKTYHTASTDVYQCVYAALYGCKPTE